MLRRPRLKCDDTRAETRFRLSAKRTSPFKSAGVTVRSTTGSRDVRISGSNVGYTMFRRSAKGTDYPLHSPVSPSLPIPCIIVFHYISNEVYLSCESHAQKPDFVFRRNGRVYLNRLGESVQSTTDSRGVRISGSNDGIHHVPR